MLTEAVVREMREQAEDANALEPRQMYRIIMLLADEVLRLQAKEKELQERLDLLDDLGGRAPTDAQRLDWLERQPGIALLSDDNRHWAAVTSGMQNVPRGRKAQDIETTFFVKAKEWRGSVRRAIDVAMRADAEEE